MVLNILQPIDFIEITSFFEIVITYNYGISFGFLSSLKLPVFVYGVGAGSIVIMLTVWMLRSQNSLFVLSLAFMIGGAIGNLIDRFTLGYVVDFLHFHWKEYSFPVFNMADVFVSLGAAGIVLDSFLRKEETK